jgi:hypothetical protein
MVYFEHLSGMRINYHKSDMTPINLDEMEANQYTEVFGCKVGTFPYRYLGIPLHFDKLKSDEVWYHEYHVFWTRQRGTRGVYHESAHSA